MLINTFSIIVPAYKEENFIESALIGFSKAFTENKLEHEIIVVVDNVPNDNTLAIAEAVSKKIPGLKIISRDGKRGIADAIQEGINHAKNYVIVIAMAENSQEPLDLVAMALKMNEGYDMVFGNRFHSGNHLEHYPKIKLLANRLCNFAIKVVFGIKSSDITNGIKVYRTQILKNIDIESTGFEIFIELPVKAFLQGNTNFSEIPIKYNGRDASFSKFHLKKEGVRYFSIFLKTLKYKIS